MPGDAGKVKCLVCAKEFTTRWNARSHYRAIHGIRETSNCHVCGKSFKGKRNRNEHLRAVHGITQAMMRQQSRPAQFSSLYWFSGWMPLGDGQRALCLLCNIETKRNKMTRHLKEVHAVGLVIHTCSTCNRQFKRKYKYDKHECKWTHFSRSNDRIRLGGHGRWHYQVSGLH